ncbi:DUF3782 domain-containing protein [Chrysosporum bergii ANA360D]|uniref:DUF3782 domain-containing protein n=1 Tax=Chrysosporum bergii ANA360D TaxID=617107 RepID=A0AA43GW40_9CYAN|nr:DUF3782 domain-containing protein [Chrysosporum bergii]MDH6062192.1 DUF3782 domain-containing protein [Chrysosporum bergii ANA360D]
MNDAELKRLLRQELPALLDEDVEIRDLLVKAISNYFAGKSETESRFDLVLAEMRRDRAEQSQKWEENRREFDQIIAQMERDRAEQSRKWDEQSQKWEENKRQFDQIIAQMERDRAEQSQKWEGNRREFDQMIAEIRSVNRKHDSTMGALGARWGLSSESSFRNAMKGILEQSFGVQVVNIVEYDDAGVVFGRPDQIELDLIIKNGELIICEIKSSVSKPDLHIFARKVEYYEQRHHRQATRKIVISPMVQTKAQTLASSLGIEIYSYAEDVPE